MCDSVRLGRAAGASGSLARRRSSLTADPLAFQPQAPCGERNGITARQSRRTSGRDKHRQNDQRQPEHVAIEVQVLPSFGSPEFRETQRHRPCPTPSIHCASPTSVDLDGSPHRLPGVKMFAEVHRHAVGLECRRFRFACAAPERHQALKSSTVAARRCRCQSEVGGVIRVARPSLAGSRHAVADPTLVDDPQVGSFGSSPSLRRSCRMKVRTRFRVVRAARPQI